MTSLSPNEPPPYWASLPQETLHALRELARQREAQEQSQLDREEQNRQAELAQIEAADPPTTPLPFSKIHPRKAPGIIVHPRSLARFKRRYAQNQRQRETAEVLHNARQLILESNATAESFTQAADYLLKLRLYEATSNPATNPETLARLFKIQGDLRRQTLAERKQTHAEQKSKTG